MGIGDERLLRALMFVALVSGCRGPIRPELLAGPRGVRLAEGGTCDYTHEAGGTWSDEGFVNDAHVLRCRGDGGRMTVRDSDGRVLYDWRDLPDGTTVHVIGEMIHVDPPPPSGAGSAPPR